MLLIKLESRYYVSPVLAAKRTGGKDCLRGLILMLLRYSVIQPLLFILIGGIVYAQVYEFTRFTYYFLITMGSMGNAYGST